MFDKRILWGVSLLICFVGYNQTMVLRAVYQGRVGVKCLRHNITSLKKKLCVKHSRTLQLRLDKLQVKGLIIVEKNDEHNGSKVVMLSPDWEKLVCAEVRRVVKEDEIGKLLESLSSDWGRQYYGEERKGD